MSYTTGGTLIRFEHVINHVIEPLIFHSTRLGNKYTKNLIKYRQIYSGTTTQISIINKNMRFVLYRTDVTYCVNTCP